jgi:hypothetical protein
VFGCMNALTIAVAATPPPSSICATFRVSPLARGQCSATTSSLFDVKGVSIFLGYGMCARWRAEPQQKKRCRLLMLRTSRKAELAPPGQDAFHITLVVVQDSTIDAIYSVVIFSELARPAWRPSCLHSWQSKRVCRAYRSR